MRLKEPLFGIRVAKMHIIMHLGLGLNYLLLENKMDNLNHDQEGDPAFANDEEIYHKEIAFIEENTI